MSDWRVIAFRQPGEAQLRGRVRRHKSGADDLWSGLPVRGAADLEAHIRGLTEANTRLLMGAAFILLDNALGEYVVGTRIGAIDWLPLPDDPAGAGLNSADGATRGGGHLTEAWRAYLTSASS